MGTIECSQPASKSSWDSQDFGDISMLLKMAQFRTSTGPRWVNFSVCMFVCVQYHRKKGFTYLNENFSTGWKLYKERLLKGVLQLIIWMYFFMRVC